MDSQKQDKVNQDNEVNETIATENVPTDDFTMEFDLRDQDLFEEIDDVNEDSYDSSDFSDHLEPRETGLDVDALLNDLVEADNRANDIPPGGNLDATLQNNDVAAAQAEEPVNEEGAVGQDVPVADVGQDEAVADVDVEEPETAHALPDDNANDIDTDHSRPGLRNYTKETLEEALAKIKSGQWTMSMAECKTGISYSTLYSIVKKNRPVFPAMGRKSRFTPEQKQDMLVYLNVCNLLRLNRTKDQFLNEVQLWLKYENKDPEKLPSRPSPFWASSLFTERGMPSNFVTPKQQRIEKEKEIDLKSWAEDRDKYIRYDCHELPTYRRQIFIVEYGRLMFNSEDGIDVLLAYNGRGQILKPIALFRGELDETVQKNYESYIAYVANLGEKRHVKAFWILIQILRVFQDCNPNLSPVFLYMTPFFRDEFYCFLTWLEAVNSSVILVNIYESIGKMFKLSNLGLMDKLKEQFATMVSLRKQAKNNEDCSLDDFPRLLLDSLTALKVVRQVESSFCKFIHLRRKGKNETDKEWLPEEEDPSMYAYVGLAFDPEPQEDTSNDSAQADAVNADVEDDEDDIELPVVHLY